MKKFLAILVSALMVIMTALPVMASTPFSDVPDYHWALDAVNLLAALGIVEGYPDGTFLGKNQATRYEVAIMIARALEYLDRDIRSLAETVGELDAKVAGLKAPAAGADPKDGVVLQPVASPDATILEQVIAEKIAGMSEAQWEQFDDRLSALLARVDDLTENNKAEHAQLWAALEAVRAAGQQPASCTDTPVVTEVQQSVATLPGCEKLVATAVAESNAAWQAAVASLDGQIKLLAAEHDNFDARIEAVRRAIYAEAEAAEAKSEAVSLDLSKKLEALSASVRAATPATAPVTPAAPADPQIVIVTVPAPQEKVDYEAAIKTLLAVHAAEERAAREAAMQELDAKIELALLQQKAEVMMAFYDSIIASNVDRDILLANLKAEMEKAIADKEAAINAAVDARHEGMLIKAIDDSSMAITIAARESLDAYRDEVDRQFENYATGVNARFAQVEGEAAQASAETNARFGNVYNQMADSALVVDGKINDIDMRLLSSTNQLNARYNELQARFDQALANQKAELIAEFGAIAGASADELNQKLAAILRAQKNEILEMLTASINEMKAAYDARLDDMEATWEIALLQQKAELMMSFYDSIAAERDAREAALQALADKYNLDLAQLKAELQVGVYDSVAAEADARERALQAFAEKHDLDLAQLKAELQVGVYDSVAAEADARERALQAFAEKHDLDLAQLKAELQVGVYDSVAAEADARERALQAFAEKHDLDLAQLKAELQVGVYDSVAAEADARARALQEMADKHDLDLAQVKAELQVGFYDSIAAESDARQRALEALAEKHDLDLLQLKAEMQMGFYDSIIALREDLEARIDVVIASIGALKDEYQKELTALSARVTNLEAQLALVAAKADQNARDIAAIRTEEIAPLTQRVRKLERETEVAQADIETNKTSISNIWTELNRVKLSGSNEVKFLDINAMSAVSGPPAGELYKNPFNRVEDPTSDDVYTPSSIMQNELKLTLTIQPDPGVKVTANIGVLTDVFGVADKSAVLPKLDLDMSIVTPSGATTIVAGELARPANLTKYQASAKVWNDKAIEGIAVAHDASKLDLSGFVAKVGHGGADATSTDYMHIAGGGGRLQLTDAVSVGVRAMLKAHDELSGDISAIDPDETIVGADVAVKLSDNWSARGELSAFDSKATSIEPTEFVYARDLAITGKLGVINVAASHAQVDEGYAPSYKGTAATDADLFEADTSLSKLTLTTDSIGGFVINGLAQRKGDADLASKDVATLGGGVKYNAELLGLGLTLRADATYNNDAFIVLWEEEGVANLGFDLKYKPVSAGFTWKNRFVDSWDPAMSYIGYVKLDAPIGGDSLKLRGGWEQSFGAEEWQIWGAGLNMAMPLIENKLTLNAEAGYDVTHGVPETHANYDEEYNDLTRLALGGGLTFNLTPDTKLTGSASYESRDYESVSAVHPSGEYLQFGAALDHKFYKNTSLTLKYDIKKVLYAAGGPEDYGVRVAGLSLKTTF